MTRTCLTIAATLSLMLIRVSCGQSLDRTPPNAQQVQPVPDVIFIPTPHDIVARMLELTSVTKTDVVYDLGCGDGRVVVAAAKEYGCRAVGFDIDANRVTQSLESVRKNRLQHLVTVKQQDLFQVDLRPASVITVYLSARYNAQLIPQFEKLKPGSRIVSHQFDMRGVTPDKAVQVISREDGRKHILYLWTTPLKRRD